MKRFVRRSAPVWLALTLASAALGQQPAPQAEGRPRARMARTAESKEQIERRLESVSVLVENSSAARQIEASANPQSLALRGRARELLQQATKAYGEANLPETSRLLNEAARLFYQGARQAAPAQIADEKNRRDFDERMESVKALLAAQQRIGAEKHSGADEADQARRVEALIRQATELASANRLEEGRALLDQAYATATQAVEGLRMGATTTRTLRFANAEQEYRYEVERGDTHLTLANKLLKEKRAANPGLEAVAQKSLQAAARLRGEAADMAAKGDYAAAIKLQESSTQELLRIVRGSGMLGP